MSKKNTIRNQKNLDRNIQKDEDLRAAIKELDTFFYRASHDLRTPIVALEGVYNMLKSTDEFGKSPALGLLKRQVTKIKGLNENIIEVGTVRSKRIENEPVNLLHLTKTIASELDMSNLTEVEIRIPEGIYINTDQALLKIILRSFMQNTINYRDHNKASKAIISTNQVNGTLTWQITDNGIGINEQLLSKLFTMFFRANVQQTGYGLSLYKSKIAAQRLNFILEIDSVEFEGTTASVQFQDFVQAL